MTDLELSQLTDQIDQDMIRILTSIRTLEASDHPLARPLARALRSTRIGEYGPTEAVLRKPREGDAQTPGTFTHNEFGIRLQKPTLHLPPPRTEPE